MPVTVTVESEVAASKYWQIAYSHVERGTVYQAGLPYPPYYQEYLEHGGAGTYNKTTWAVTTDNALASPSVVAQNAYLDQEFDYDANTSVQTAHNETWGAGAQVNITLPTFDPAWGRLAGFNAYIVGDLTAKHTVTTANYMTARAAIQDNSSFYGATARMLFRPTTGEWNAVTGWVPYGCGSPYLANGREPIVARQRYLVCDAAYRNIGIGNGDFAGATERFQFLKSVSGTGAEGGGAVPSDMSGALAWANGAAGLTKQLYVVMNPSAWGALIDFNRDHVAAGTFIERKLEWNVNFQMQNMKVVLDLFFDGIELPKSASGAVGLDCFDDIIASCWALSPSGGSNPRKQLVIGIQRALEKNIGSGTGSTGGWDIYNYGDVDQRSPIGFLFLPNGWLFLSFNVYDGSGNPTAYYTVNKNHGEKPVSNWSPAATLTPNVAQALGIGRSMGMAFRTRIG